MPPLEAMKLYRMLCSFNYLRERSSERRGEEEQIRFLDDWAACWDVDGLVTAITACCNSLAHFHRSVPGSAGGRLGRAWEALWSTERLLGG